MPGKFASGKPPAQRGFGKKPEGAGRPPERKGFVKKPEGPGPGTYARLVALDTLLDVHLQDAYASLALGERLKNQRVPGPMLQDRDKRLVTELVYGTLERQLRLDFVLEGFLERRELDPVVRDILRMGIYQLIFLDRIPANAAVDESVKLTRLKQRERYSGMVNAILRNIDRQKDAIAYPDPAEQPVQYLSVMYSVLPWLAEQLLDAYGMEEAERILAYRAAQHYMTLRPNPERMTAEAFEAFLRKEGLTFERGKVPGAYRVFHGGDLTRFPAWRQGLFSIQGESAMLAAQAVGVSPGWQVLDACAAPGGKTAVLAEAMHGSGRVYAWDIHPHRVQLIRAMALRLQLENVRTMERDATQFKEDWVGALDAVLVDAPCSGTGVIWDKPDSRYRQDGEKLEALVQTQHDLLEACAGYVKPGGVLVYATCSILPQENEQQVRAFLAVHPEFSPRGLTERVPEALRHYIREGGLQILPYRDDMEGFYLCRMVRER